MIAKCEGRIGGNKIDDGRVNGGRMSGGSDG